MTRVMIVLGLDGDAAQRFLDFPAIMSCDPRVRLRVEVIPEDGSEPVTLSAYTFQATDMVDRVRAYGGTGYVGMATRADTYPEQA